MEVSIVSKNSIRLKGKKVTLVVDPDTKTTGDLVLLLKDSGKNALSLVEGSQIITQGAGEYEIGGTKFTSFSTPEGYAYDINLDAVRIFLTTGSVLDTLKEKITDRDMLILQCSDSVNSASVAQLSPKVLILYGEKCQEVAKGLGQVTPETTKKFVTTLEKLPAEMQTVILS